MKPSENGTYRWRYSVNLYKNPGLLWLFYKVFCGIFAGCLLFGLFLSDFKVSLAGDEDFDFVLDYITSHCPKLKKKGT